MKKIKMLILLICSLVFIPNVFASSASVSMGGSNTIKVGETTNIYVNMSASDLIKGVDISYQASGNITVTNVSAGSGLSVMAQNGNRYMMYSLNGVNSGSTVLIITVKGNQVGSGTVTVSNVEATVGDVTAYANSNSYNITIKEQPKQPEKPTPNSTPTKVLTEAERKAREEAARKAKEEQEKKEQEELKKAISDAEALVKKAEESYKIDDFNAANNAVAALKDCNEKTDLQKRLTELKNKLESKDRNCPSITDTVSCNECEKTSNTSWIVLCIVLALILMIETGYLVYKKVKANEE